MKRFFKITISVLVLLLTLSSLSKAEIDIGYARQSGWSDNFYFRNPDGWSLYLSKSFSKKMSIRFTYSKLINNFSYFGEMTFGFPPIDMIVTRELIGANVTARLYELSLHHAIAEGSKMRMDIGAGLGGSKFKLRMTGQSTAKTMLFIQNPIILTFDINVTVKKFLHDAMAMRIGYQYRSMGTLDFSTDIFLPFRDVSYSNIRIDIMARFNAASD